MQTINCQDIKEISEEKSHKNQKDEKKLNLELSI
jgi:hypothetical protein